LARHPPSIRSYLAALVMRRVHALGARIPNEGPYGREAKERIARRILEEVVAEARRRDLPLELVFFFPRYELDHVGWRETFLKTEAERLGVPYLDTKELYLAEARRRGVQPDAFFDGGHPNALGNELVAAALAERLRAPYGASRSQSAP